MNQCQHCGAERRVASLSFWYMHDNHTFARLSGDSLGAILDMAREVHAKGKYSGMVCGALLLDAKGKEIRRIRADIHAYSHRDDWGAQERVWLAAHEADADVMRLLSTVSVSQAPATQERE